MDIQVIKTNSLNINRGLYVSFMGNTLSDANATQLISEGAAVLVNLPNPKVNTPYILAQSAVPSILAPAGTWNNTTGSLTLGTALPYTPVGVVRIYLFASGIAQAGLYWATFSSTTACQVYADTTLAQLASTAGAYTPTVATDIALATINIPANAMGNNGSIRVKDVCQVNNSAGNKVIRTRFAGNNIRGVTATTSTNQTGVSNIINRGVANSQAFDFINYNGSAIGTGLGSTLTVNTANDQQLTFIFNIATATDFGILEGYTVEILPSP